MLNYETILSSYDDKMTLMQWLKKVEKALKNASATGFSVNKKGNATISFKVDFADGTSIESNDIVLQQGESVSNARMVNGHLFIDLTNGETFDVGNLKPVTRFEIDASQHLIVYYGDGTNQDLGNIFSGNVNINGNLTANSIIENMSGYSVTINPNNVVGLTITPKYVSACKNGNKITFVVFVLVNKSSSYAGIGREVLCQFVIPTDVADKLIPFSLSGFSNVLECKKLNYVQGITSIVDQNGFITKPATNYISFQSYINNLTEDLDYLVRFEQTFLLNESLAGN